MFGLRQRVGVCMVGTMRTEAFIEGLEMRRRIASRMFERNLCSQEIAELLEVHPQTIRAWRRVFEAGGWEALKAKPHLGPRCRLTDQQKQEYLALLERSCPLLHRAAN